jgi:hypothetical protein
MRIQQFLMIYILAVTEIWAFKGAFIFMYADLYDRTVNVRKHGLYATAALIPLTYIGLLIAALMECRPLSENWYFPSLGRDKSHLLTHIGTSKNSSTPERSVRPSPQHGRT